MNLLTMTLLLLVLAGVLLFALLRWTHPTPVQGGPEAGPPSALATPHPGRVTIRKYAHESYPHPDECEVRPLALEVPYLYAQAIGFETWGTGWFDMREGDGLLASAYRIHLLMAARHQALLADALAQGMRGDEAWKWAAERAWDEEGSWVYERAIDGYGLEPEKIKPYPCGPEPDHHTHYSEPDSRGWRTGKRIAGKESECLDCTVEVEQPDPNQLSLPFTETAVA